MTFGLLYLTGRSTQKRFACKHDATHKEPPPCPRKRRGVSSFSPRGDAAQARARAASEARAVLPAAARMVAEPPQLCDPGWLVPHVVQLSHNQMERALETYHAALSAGLVLQDVRPTESRQLFLALITSAIRLGHMDQALGLLHDLKEHGPGLNASLLASATKLCTSRQHYAECLAIYDLAIEEDPALVIEDRSIWSCLLFCAVEARCFQRCNFLFERLKAAGKPSLKDYGNMIRYAATNNDCEVALSLVQEMREAGLEIDSVVYNTALATCVGANKVDQAHALLQEMEHVGGVVDVITYNTLAKGYAKAGRMDRCFELYEHMRGGGIQPSQVTYGILLDGCINDNKVDRAVEVYDEMRREGCPMNTVLYTTLIKGFARAGQVDQAMRVYGQMRSEGGVPPDLITFSILIKANCDYCHLESALMLLEAMVDLKLRPDEVIFNNLLGGCVKESNVELARRLYQEMVAAGIRPSNATFSIFIRLYSQCKLLDEAVEMLRSEPAAQGVSPEPRLFSQLALCCLRERQGRRAVEVYRLLLERSAPTAAAHSSMLGMCVKLNMLDTGAEILSMAAAANGRVDAKDALALLEAAQRKRKAQCVDACAMAMRRLGLASGPMEFLSPPRHL
eukprot:CAMPEP_0171088832 /NCGR_PEP_ID=MMETSP0766_2-20121228/21014_1 /TAXON_ID=439317 /ORGANISM="Gambierdiscus australes, Strain CAWD 149" /LENGTH=622 /DNA_ID=CAMNT_0011546653 /DNA_START=102 /DNA_END=1970 /DNA_ORIENTATION=+